jgi:DNA-binding transcriptional MerR regulator/predicted enzyme related to lactoylglutathione lyase
LGSPRVDDGVMNDLMEIGKFATASGLSVDVLRHYDEVGVLKPASVDPRTSYRRYDGAQLRDARLICQLRGVDLPVDEVRAVLQADGPEQVQGILHRHQRRLAERAHALEKMLATSETYVEKGVPLPPRRACRVVQVMVSTRDHDESVRFYTEAFGLEFNPDVSSFALGAYNTDSFFLLTVENWLDGGTPSSFGLVVDDVDARHATALALGATEISPPTDYSWKPRGSVIDDPSGNRIQLSQG